MRGSIKGTMTFEKVVVEPSDMGYLVRGAYGGEPNSTVLEASRGHLYVGGLPVSGLDGDLVLEPEEPGTPEEWVWAVATGDDLYLQNEEPEEDPTD